MRPRVYRGSRRWQHRPAPRVPAAPGWAAAGAATTSGAQPRPPVLDTQWKFILSCPADKGRGGSPDMEMFL